MYRSIYWADMTIQKRAPKKSIKFDKRTAFLLAIFSNFFKIAIKIILLDLNPIKNYNKKTP